MPDTGGYYWVEGAGLADERACLTRLGTTGWSVLAWLMREPASHGWVLLGGVCWPG